MLIGDFAIESMSPWESCDAGRNAMGFGSSESLLSGAPPWEEFSTTEVGVETSRGPKSLAYPVGPWVQLKARHTPMVGSPAKGACVCKTTVGKVAKPIVEVQTVSGLKRGLE